MEPHIGMEPPLRCKDGRHGWMYQGEAEWCLSARIMDPEEIPMIWGGDHRSTSIIRVCTKTNRFATWNKKCDVKK